MPQPAGEEPDVAAANALMAAEPAPVAADTIGSVLLLGANGEPHDAADSLRGWQPSDELYSGQVRSIDDSRPVHEANPTCVAIRHGPYTFGMGDYATYAPECGDGTALEAGMAPGVAGCAGQGDNGGNDDEDSDERARRIVHRARELLQVHRLELAASENVPVLVEVLHEQVIPLLDGGGRAMGHRHDAVELGEQGRGGTLGERGEQCA